MAYVLEIPLHVEEYLRDPPHTLSRLGRLALFGYSVILRDHADTIRAEPGGRISPELFFFDYLFQDRGQTYRLIVYVEDANAAMGVLTVRYAELQHTPPMP